MKTLMKSNVYDSKNTINWLIAIYLTPKKYDRLDENLSFLCYN